MDRDAITKYLETHSFDTLIGKVALPGRKLNWLYTVGQWQGDMFRAVAGVGVEGTTDVKLKSGW